MSKAEPRKAKMVSKSPRARRRAIAAHHAEAALKHLRASDPVMAKLIDSVGPFALRLESDRFGMLVRSILSQQLSTKAAATIRQRLFDLVAPESISPQNLAALSIEQLRGVGVSGQKASFLLDLADAASSGRIQLKRIGRKPDEAIITELTQVRGIGRWTAQMFLMFALGRLDVFPYDDLGVRAAIRHLYGLAEMPDKTTSHAIAAPWKPYASVASWYCWRSLELRQALKAAATTSL